MRPTRYVFVSALAALVLGGTSVPSGAAVSAAPQARPAPPSHGVAPASPPATSDSSHGQRRATATDTIVCTPNVQNPHNSSHVNGTVNVVVTLSCTAPVSQINIRAALYRNGALVRDSGQRTVNGSSFAQNNAAEPCHNATYQGWMSYGVAFPPGYVPPTGSGSGYGSAVTITC
ncbi:MAG TPA: hypothetical protein VGO94_09770 [Mycobacteriales bacterium]|nr:hypothetical protein [Mycobacteriales bacterium]